MSKTPRPGFYVKAVNRRRFVRPNHTVEWTSCCFAIYSCVASFTGYIGAGIGRGGRWLETSRV